MIVEMEITVPIKYLKEAQENLGKIKIPRTDDIDLDVTNKTALMIAISNLSAVIANMKKDMKSREKEMDEIADGLNGIMDRRATDRKGTK